MCQFVTDSATIINKTDIAETLATSFAAKSSSDHYQENFRRIRDKEKEKSLDFESDNDEKYNVNFSKRELIKSIPQATDSATGPDEIHYQFLKHLPDVSGGRVSPPRGPPGQLLRRPSTPKPFIEPGFSIFLT